MEINFNLFYFTFKSYLPQEHLVLYRMTKDKIKIITVMTQNDRTAYIVLLPKTIFS